MYFEVNLFFDLEKICVMYLEIGVEDDSLSGGIRLHYKLEGGVFQNFRNYMKGVCVL